MSRRSGVNDFLNSAGHQTMHGIYAVPELDPFFSRKAGSAAQLSFMRLYHRTPRKIRLTTAEQLLTIVANATRREPAEA
jgi:hypothetical protein